MRDDRARPSRHGVVVHEERVGALEASDDKRDPLVIVLASGLRISP